MKDRIAQWISASDFGSEGRGFDSHCGRIFFAFELNFYVKRHRFLVLES